MSKEQICRCQSTAIFYMTKADFWFAEEFERHAAECGRRAEPRDPPDDEPHPRRALRSHRRHRE